MSNVQLGYTQVIDPISFKSIPSGKIYIGEYGTLPNPANAGTWKQAYFVNSDGTRTAASQPIATNAAGYAVDGSGNIKTVQVDGQYSILVQSSLGVTKFSAAKVAPLASADQIDVGSGRTQSDKNAEIISVRDYITTAVDGVTSNQAGIVAAIAAAYASGAQLYWPVGVYVSDANIPNLHVVRHFGEGVIKRGLTLFYVCPSGSQANTINISTSGSDTNDGITTSQPVATFQKAFDILKNYGPLLEGIWSVVAGAGTWVINGGQQTHTTPSVNRVIIRGPFVGHPNVPTCVIDGSGGAQYAHGLSVSGIGVRADVRDLKFQNFTNSFTRIGLVGENESDLYTQNIHAYNCDWTGIYAFNVVRGRISGGVLDSCRSGFIANDAEVTLGYGASNTSEGTIITNCTEYGVYWSRGSQGHIDYCKLENNAIAFVVAENSRCDTVGNDFKLNNVAIRARTGGIFGEGSVPNVFNNGTADANNTNIEYKAYSGDAIELGASESWSRVAYDRTTRSHSGTTPSTLTTPYTIPARRLQGPGKQCRVLVSGFWTAVSSGSTVTVNFGGMAFQLVVPGAVSSSSFEIDVTLYEVAGGYRAIGTIRQGLSQHRMGTSTSGFVNSSDQIISVSVAMSGAGDAVNIYRTDVYLMG